MDHPERHVQVAVASDAVVGHPLHARTGPSYAEPTTPTDAHAVPLEVVADARRQWDDRGWRGRLQAPLRALFRGALYAPAYGTTVRRDDGTEVGIADALVPLARLSGRRARPRPTAGTSPPDRR